MLAGAAQNFWCNIEKMMEKHLELIRFVSSFALLPCSASDNVRCVNLALFFIMLDVVF